MSPFHGIRHGTERGIPTEHNVQRRIVRGLVARSVPPPTGPKTGPGDNISSTPKPWQSFAYGITDLEAAEAVELHPRRFLLGQQRVGQESVAVEDSVIGSHVCFEKPHRIFRHPFDDSEVTQ